MDNRTPYNRAGPGKPIPSYDDWNLVHRGTMAPWGVYEKDGQTASGFAVPAMVTEPIEAGKRFLGEGGGLWQLPNKQNTEDVITLLMSLYGGNALSHAVRPVAPAGSLGMFAGRRAATADLNALARAEKMAGEGAGRDAIWNETGWFQGPDQKWRFEIDDSGSQFTIPQQERHALNGQPIQGSAAFVYRHPDLWNAYPDEARLPVNIARGDGPFKGFYDGKQIGGEAETTGAARELMLHETQHAIQRNEGFARGGNRSLFTPEEIAAERARIGAVPEDTMGWTSVGSAAGDMPDTDVAHVLYKRLAGETEARNVQTRMDMTPEQRRATPPWETQDIPYEDQIVRLLSDTGRPSLMGSAVASQDRKVWPVNLPDGVSIERSGPNNYLAMAGNVPIGQSYVRDLGNNIQIGNVSVFDPSWQRKGIGSAFYGVAERDFGKPHVPDVNLSDAAYQLWLKNDPQSVAGYRRMPWGQWMQSED